MLGISSGYQPLGTDTPVVSNAGIEAMLNHHQLCVKIAKATYERGLGEMNTIASSFQLRSLTTNPVEPRSSACARVSLAKQHKVFFSSCRLTTPVGGDLPHVRTTLNLSTWYIPSVQPRDNFHSLRDLFYIDQFCTRYTSLQGTQSELLYELALRCTHHSQHQEAKKQEQHHLDPKVTLLGAPGVAKLLQTSFSQTEKLGASHLCHLMRHRHHQGTLCLKHPSSS